MACSNCFNRCTDIISDQCVKYTGIDIPLLGIENGDSLSYVEQSLIGFLSSTLDGTGIKPTIDPDIICTLVEGYLPTCADLTIVDIVTALIKAACDLQSQITAVADDIATLNADYDTNCLIGISDSADTHDVLQATLNKLCTLDNDLAIFMLEVANDYVKLVDLNDLIDAHLAATSTLISNKMVPYAVVPYFGPLTNFDITGAGTGDWIDIYLCNGANGTPDMRGRIPVGTISGVGGGALDIEVDPMVSAFNPNYALLDTEGANYNLLGISQIPAHTHANTASSTQVAHYHYEFNADQDIASLVSATNCAEQSYRDSTASYNYTIRGTSTIPTYGKSSSATPVITTVITNASSGGGQAHSNLQPVMALHYITYIP